MWHPFKLCAGSVPRRLALVSVALFAAGLLWFVGTHCSPYAGGADSSGYLNEARLLLAGRIGYAPPQIAGLSEPGWPSVAHQPLGFVYRSDLGLMTPIYPVGLPLHLVLAAKMVGLDHAMVLVSLLCVVAAGGLSVATGRLLGLPQSWALAGGVTLLLSPLFLFMVGQPMSDALAMVWVCAACYFSLRARDGWAWAFPAGFAVAVAVLVRPTNLLVMLPVAVALGFRWKAWLALALAGAPGAAFLAWYNLQLYGKALTTGYGDISDALSPKYVPHNVLHFITWLMVLLSPLVAVASFGLPGLYRRQPFVCRFLLVWVSAFVGFYVWYYCAGDAWWYLRFILPVFPPVIFAGLLVLHHFAGEWVKTRYGRYVCALGIAAGLIWLLMWGRSLNVGDVKRGESVYPESIAWLNANVPANAIVLEMQLSGAAVYHGSQTLVRWDKLGAEHWPQLYAAAQAGGRPVYAVLMEFEVREGFPNRIPGRWEKIHELRNVSFWRLVGDDLQEPGRVF